MMGSPSQSMQQLCLKSKNKEGEEKGEEEDQNEGERRGYEITGGKDTWELIAKYNK